MHLQVSQKLSYLLKISLLIYASVIWRTFLHRHLHSLSMYHIAQAAGAVEYTERTSAEG